MCFYVGWKNDHRSSDLLRLSSCEKDFVFQSGDIVARQGQGWGLCSYVYSRTPMIPTIAQKYGSGGSTVLVLSVTS